MGIFADEGVCPVVSSPAVITPPAEMQRIRGADKGESEKEDVQESVHNTWPKSTYESTQ